LNRISGLKEDLVVPFRCIIIVVVGICIGIDCHILKG
jgi:hypothetical protein